MPNWFGKGNINLFSRPRVIGPDGRTSTVLSQGINEDGQEIVIPMVDRHGKRLLTSNESVDQYKKTGEFLGKFLYRPEASEYGEQLHRDFESGDYDVPLASSRNNINPDKLERSLLMMLLGKRIK